MAGQLAEGAILGLPMAEIVMRDGRKTLGSRSQRCPRKSASILRIDRQDSCWREGSLIPRVGNAKMGRSKRELRLGRVLRRLALLSWSQFLDRLLRFLR